MRQPGNLAPTTTTPHLADGFPNPLSSERHRTPHPSPPLKADGYEPPTTNCTTSIGGTPCFLCVFAHAIHTSTTHSYLPCFLCVFAHAIHTSTTDIHLHVLYTHHLLTLSIPSLPAAMLFFATSGGVTAKFTIFWLARKPLLCYNFLSAGFFLLVAAD